MRIAILNESFLSPKHLKILRGLGEVLVYNDTDTEEKATDRLRGAELAIADCYVVPLNKKVFENAEELKFLSINSTGYDPVDITAAKNCGIKVANVPGFSTEAVAEHAIALMLAVSKKISAGDRAMRKQPFEINPASADHKKYLGFNLAGRTLGVVGFGSIGARVAEIAIGFGMKVLIFNRSSRSIPGINQVSLEDLLKESDIVSLHLPLMEETEKIIGERELNLMKPNAVIVNTARGCLIDEAKLVEALAARKIAGAGLDTINDWSENNPLLKLDNVVFSPHSAWFTEESLKNAADIIVKNILAFAKGEPINIVNF